ncbi:uncharacterized protein METZ01_LOCUS389360, partial [marine metagenome]
VFVANPARVYPYLTQTKGTTLANAPNIIVFLTDDQGYGDL